jgi:type IV pilus assembly protein PilB
VEFQCAACGAELEAHPSAEDRERGAVVCAVCGEPIRFTAHHKYLLAKLRYMTDEEVTDHMADKREPDRVDLEGIEIPDTVLALLSRELCEKYSVIPIARKGTTITVAMADPSKTDAMGRIRFMTNCDVKPVVVSEKAIRNAIAKHYGDGGNGSK